MTKYVFLLLVAVSTLFSDVFMSPIVSVNEDSDEATVKIEKIDIGISGFIVHELADNHTIILKEIFVSSYDGATKTATLKMQDFNLLKSNSLPTGDWHVEVGDKALLAFGYSRALLVAPSEEIYHKITEATQSLQWLHPDIFASMLSFSGHPSPQREDFDNLCNSASVGLLFFYLEEKLLTVDGKSFKVLNISDAPLKEESPQKPFYTRVTKIDKAWFGAGSSEMGNYTSYYFDLLQEYNQENKVFEELYAKYKSEK